jgi:hypothetical protein
MQLQMEIDKLALMLDEVRRQSDRIQAIADSIGDRLLHGVGVSAEAAGGSKNGRSHKVVQISAPPSY